MQLNKHSLARLFKPFTPTQNGTYKANICAVELRKVARMN